MRELCEEVGIKLEKDQLTFVGEYAGKFKMGKMDIQAHPQAAGKFGIRSIPALLFFKDGQVQKKWVGLTSKKDLAAAIDEYL